MIRVTEALRKRLAKLAAARDTTAKMKKTRSGIPATEVFDYLESRARGGSPPRPKPRRTA